MVEFWLKWKKVPSLIVNGFNLRSCFLLRQKCILGRSLPPLGLYYSPRFARGCKADPRGVKTALGYTFPWAGINFLGEIHFRLRKVPFLWTSLSLEKRVLVRLMDLDRFKTMEEQSDSYQYHKGRFMKTILIPCEALLIYHWMSMAIFTENKQTPKNCSLTNMVT